MANTKREPGMYWYCKFTPWKRLVDNGYITVIYDNLISVNPEKVLGEVVLPEGIVTISKNAFKNCKFISKVELPDSVKIVDEFSFFKCTELEEIKFGKGLQEVRRSAFSYCNKLKNVKLPDSVIVIGSDAFYDCYNLNSIKMPKNLSDIGENAFWNCVPNHVIWRGEDYRHIFTFLEVFEDEGCSYGTSFFK